ATAGLWTRAESGGVDCVVLAPSGGGGDGGGTTGGGGTSGGAGGAGSGGGGSGGSSGGLGPYPGFGGATTGGDGHPVLSVTTDADGGAGSLRDALAQARAAGGGIVRFALAAPVDIRPGAPLEVPANTTI